MQSRRREEFVTLSPSAKSRNQRRTEAGDDPYSVSRRDEVNRSPRGRRSLSPRTLDRSRRVLVRRRRSGSLEKREYGWHVGGGRTETARSRSPPYRQVHKIPHLDKEIVNRKYEFESMDYTDGSNSRLRHSMDFNEGSSSRLRQPIDHNEGSNPRLRQPIDYNVGSNSRLRQSMDYSEGSNSRLRHPYEYDRGSIRMSNEKDYIENRVVSIDGYVKSGQKSVPMEDVALRRSHRLPPDLGRAVDYGETTGHLALTSRCMDIDGYEHERLQYREAIPSDRLRVMESYERHEPICRSRDVSYGTLTTSHSKDFTSASSDTARNRFLNSYHDDVPLLVSEEYHRTGGQLAEPVELRTFEPRALANSVRDPDAAKRNVTLYKQGEYSPSRAEREGYFYRKPREIENHDHGYPSNSLRRMVPQVKFDHSPINYGHMSRANVLHPVVDRVESTDASGGNPRNNIMLEHPTLQTETVTDYLDTGRFYASKPGGEYMGSGHTNVEFERRLPQDYEASRLDVSRDRQESALKANYGFGKGADTGSHKVGLRDSPLSKYDQETCRVGIKMQRMKEDELHLYEPSDGIAKKKFSMEENGSRPSSKTVMYRKLSAPGDFEDQYDTDDWIDGEIRDVNLPRTRGLGSNDHRKARREYNGQDHHEDLGSDNWDNSQDSLACVQRPPVRFYKNSGIYVKGHAATSSSNWNASHQDGRRSNFQKQKKVWKRNDGYEEEYRNDGDTINDLVDLKASDTCEDSEEFKRLVHGAFLKFSRMLNLNQSVRRRYKEEGNAGSLYCIVCGKSYSKEFLDTQRLVTHAFMSHKVGLRTEHLGLHKAICVLLGWDSSAPPDTVTWVPPVLPEAEALSQQEDLILWPPIVVIHNISMSNNIPKEQKVIPIEGVQAFLRDKGLVGGKINVCLGRPADQSVMVVKFLNTFTGLENAESLHKYFVEHQRGRVEFRRLICKAGVSDREIIDKSDEHLLYGYMAISEDLDKLDYNNKKCSVVKSKKEIQELANAPVKSDDR